ncbi:MAG: hypothetical protein IJ428_01400 [Clostridia bacterium]|nr:hypothetical protein [Clostridia bacterium]
MQTYITPSGKARIERLRSRALKPSISYVDFHYRFWKYFLSLDESRSRYDRYAEAYTYAFEHVTPVIDDDELIVGKVAARLTANEKADREPSDRPPRLYAVQARVRIHIWRWTIPFCLLRVQAA